MPTGDYSTTLLQFHLNVTGNTKLFVGDTLRLSCDVSKADRPLFDRMLQDEKYLFTKWFNSSGIGNSITHYFHCTVIRNILTSHVHSIKETEYRFYRFKGIL